MDKISFEYGYVNIDNIRYTIKVVYVDKCTESTIQELLSKLNGFIDSFYEGRRALIKYFTSMIEWDAGDAKISNISYHPYESPFVGNYTSLSFYNNSYVSSIKIVGGENITSCENLFRYCDNLTNLNIEDFITSNVTNMEKMFYECKSIKNIDLSNLDTSNVTNMKDMFYNCSSLETLDLSNFNTTNVGDNTSNMFTKCTSLKYVYVDNCDDATITKLIDRLRRDMDSFTLKTIDGRKVLCKADTVIWDGGDATINDKDYDSTNSPFVDNIDSLSFSYNRSVENITIKNCGNLTTCKSMFFQCNNLNSVDLRLFNSSKITSMVDMFNECHHLETLYLTNLDTSNVTDMQCVFGSCGSIENLNVSMFNTSKVTNMSYMFGGCQNITTLNLSNFDTKNVTNMSNMFQYCGKLKTLDLSNFDMNKVTSYAQMFLDCSALETIYVDNCDDNTTYKLLYILGASRGTYYLTENSGRKCIVKEMYSTKVSWDEGNAIINGDTLDIVSSPYRKRITSLSFNGNDSATSISIELERSLDSCENLLKDCTNLTSLDITKMNTSDVTNMSNMFAYCESLKEIDLNISKFNTSKVTDMSYMFAGCKKLTGAYLTTLNTSNVTDMSNMFNDCENLTYLNLAHFDTSNVTNMSNMFSGCKNLEEINLSGFKIDYTNCDCTNMFNGCKNLLVVYIVDCDEFTLYRLKQKLEECSGNYVQGYYKGTLAFLKIDTEIYWDSGDVVIDGTTYDSSNSPYYSYLINGKVNNISFENNTSVKTVSIMYSTGLSTLKRMFKNCTSLESIDLHTCFFKNVSSMYEFCYNCESLTRLNINFHSYILSDMERAFYNCKSLEELDISSIGTTSVTDFSYLFYGCEKLRILKATFESTRVKSLSGVFEGCKSLVYRYTAFDCTYVYTTSYMYANCDSYEILSLAFRNTSNITSMYGMFRSCDNLKTIHLNDLDTSNVENMGHLFADCNKLTSIQNLYNLNTSKVTNMACMFRGLDMPSMDVSFLDTRNVTDMSYMFGYMTYINAISKDSFRFENAPNFRTSKVTNMCGMFISLGTSYTGPSQYTFKDLNLSKFDTSNVTDMSYMFCGCAYLFSIDISNFNLSKVTNMEKMFFGCYSNVYYVDNCSSSDVAKLILQLSEDMPKYNWVYTTYNNRKAIVIQEK